MSSTTQDSINALLLERSTLYTRFQEIEAELAALIPVQQVKDCIKKGKLDKSTLMAEIAKVEKEINHSIYVSSLGEEG